MPDTEAAPKGDPNVTNALLKWARSEAEVCPDTSFIRNWLAGDDAPVPYGQFDEPYRAIYASVPESHMLPLVTRALRRATAELLNTLDPSKEDPQLQYNLFHMSQIFSDPALQYAPLQKLVGKVHGKYGYKDLQIPFREALILNQDGSGSSDSLWLDLMAGRPTSVPGNWLDGFKGLALAKSPGKRNDFLSHLGDSVLP